MAYVAPTYKGKAFTCPFCGVYTIMNWVVLKYVIEIPSAPNRVSESLVTTATCFACKKNSYWIHTLEPSGNPIDTLTTTMVYPSKSTAPLPHTDMPDDIQADYEEARNICNQSPRSASTLLRLAIQKLCVHLGEKGKNLNNDIGNLVKQGLPVEIQQALDVVRVIGNNAVHPGEINPEDVQEISNQLFELVNFIVEDRISRPAKLKKLYDNLPSGALDGIEKRDDNT